MNSKLLMMPHTVSRTRFVFSKVQVFLELRCPRVNDMAELAGVEQAQVTDVAVEWAAGAEAVVSVRPIRGARARCTQCGRRSPQHDQAAETRRVAVAGSGVEDGLRAGPGTAVSCRRGG